MKKSFAALVSCLLLGTCASANAADTTQVVVQQPTLPVNTWHYEIAPYLWGSAISGQTTVVGHAVSMQIPFSKIWRDLQFAIQFHLELSNGPWALMLDPTYVKLGQNLPLIHSHLDTELTLVDAGVFYRLFSVEMKHKQGASLELLGGARYFGLDNEIDFPIGRPAIDNTQVIAPIVGARIKYHINKLGLWVRGDVGGFHLDKVDRTWSWTAGLGYAVTPCFDIGAAYKVLQIDYNGSRDSQMNTRLYGPLVGFNFHD